MRILITGSTGLVGSGLIPYLTSKNHRVSRLVRKPNRNKTNGVQWEPSRGIIDIAGLEGFDAVVHLAGESIAKGRWTPAKKAKIRDSRVKGTQLLSDSLVKLSNRPKVLVCASAIGYYGDRGDELLNEESAPGSLFLSQVCREWEAATYPAAQNGIRVVNLRFGVILSATGGALATMLRPFRLGLGGIVGNGKQYWSWISLDDVLRSIEHAISTGELRGPVNAVAPHPVTNYEFTKTLGRALSRPTIFPMPAFAAHLAFGEMADELLLASTRVTPAKLLATGFVFMHPTLEEALRNLLS